MTTPTSLQTKLDSLELFQLPKNRQVSWKALQRLLPDLETAMFFVKVYELPRNSARTLIETLFESPILEQLKEGHFSTALQDTIEGLVEQHQLIDLGLTWKDDRPDERLLTASWREAELQVAQSIKDVANKLGAVLDAIPRKGGELTFQHMAKMNRTRPTIGTFQAGFRKRNTGKNLVILDDSGSMSETTIRAIAEDVVALSYTADATLALVSNSCRVFPAGTFTVDSVLQHGEYGGTRYAKLEHLLNEDWDVVVTIADYDSSQGSKDIISRCTGKVGKVLDLSFVNRPTFLGEVVGQLADSVEPLIISNSHYPIGSGF